MLTEASSHEDLNKKGGEGRMNGSAGGGCGCCFDCLRLKKIVDPGMKFSLHDEYTAKAF